MALTIKQAQANYKKYFKTDAPVDLSIEALTSAIDEAKLAASAKAAELAAAKAAELAITKAAKAPKFKARFPKVEIPGMGVFTDEELEANNEVCEYLLKIGSPAVTEL